MITLALDASTYAGDACVLSDRAVLAEESVAMKGAQEERLMPAVARVLERANLSVASIDRVVCGAGPGSFTSLRIAGAIAKGLAAGAGRPLFAVPSLALMVGGAALRPGRYLAATDALRGEYYVGLYERAADGRIDELERARLVPADDVMTVAESYGAITVSPAALPNGVSATPHASAVRALEHLLAERGPVDIASWEPAYGRLAEAQVRWESAHGKPLPAG